MSNFSLSSDMFNGVKVNSHEQFNTLALRLHYSGGCLSSILCQRMMHWEGLYSPLSSARQWPVTCLPRTPFPFPHRNNDSTLQILNASQRLHNDGCLPACEICNANKELRVCMLRSRTTPAFGTRCSGLEPSLSNHLAASPALWFVSNAYILKGSSKYHLVWRAYTRRYKGDRLLPICVKTGRGTVTNVTEHRLCRRAWEKSILAHVERGEASK